MTPSSRATAVPTGLFPPVVAALAQTIARQIRYDRGAYLFHSGDEPSGIHLILEGRIRVRRTAPSGRAIVVHHETAGGILGEIPLFDGGRYPATAVAAEPSVCVLLPRDALLRALHANPELTEFFLGRLARRLREVIGRLDATATRSVAERLARHLLDRRRRAAGPRISLGMTQAELAEDIGTVREVVVRELRLLCRAGILEAAGAGRYVVRDGEALRELAGEPAGQSDIS